MLVYLFTLASANVFVKSESVSEAAVTVVKEAKVDVVAVFVS